MTRHRGVTAGTGCGRCRGAVRGGRRARRAVARRARAKLPPRNGETPATLAAYDWSPAALLTPSVARAYSRSLALAVGPGAPKVRP